MFLQSVATDFQILTADASHGKGNTSENMTWENLWSVRLSLKNTLILTFAGGRPFKISLTEPLLMCSTAASIEDKKNLNRNETCSIKTNSTTTTITTWIRSIFLPLQFDHKNIAQTIEFLDALIYFAVFWFELSSLAILLLRSLFAYIN